MRLQLLPVALVALCVSTASARAHWSLTEDLYAFPKYRVTFLNGLPVLNDTAERWLSAGLKGGEPEFLDQPWQDSGRHRSEQLQGIESGDGKGSESLEATTETPQTSKCRLQRMQLAGKVEEPQIEANAAQSWSLLQPLSNSCIYHRQGWFTYAYCHNNQVRQFREIAHSHPHVGPGYVPEEDHEWEAFTLGQAATIPGEGHELTNAQQELLTSSVDITMTDTILFVKETSTCNYIMVINTPRLCGEPGFRTRLEQRDEAFIRCREVLGSKEDVAAVDKTLPISSHPFKRPARHSIPDIPSPASSSISDDEARAGIDQKKSERLRAAIQVFLSGGAKKAEDGSDAVIITGEDGDMMFDIEFIDAEDADEALDKIEDILAGASGKLERLEEALRAAGYGDASFVDDVVKERKRKNEDKKRTAQHEEL
ncbi:hypothetical protein EW145_g6793 [Phellinidium pouzarii]|uniref:Protein OS-9 homolog n=1 Tax=Phellinidium pouzarii TaxID=167371 RepID=A0A4S4KTV8_9AGAM|nr:hypothetical protein EW145_g6793 [Phellinidium pouzarii]